MTEASGKVESLIQSLKILAYARRSTLGKQYCSAKRIQRYQATRNPADLLNRENGSDVNALFRWSFLRPYYIDSIDVGGLQLI